MARIFSNGEYHDVPPIFSMSLPNALLVFSAELDETSDEYGPDYAVYCLPPRTDPPRRSLTDMTEGMSPVGRIPVSDVEFDETRGLTLHTMGIERFADPS